jgi:hypothetical protein
MRVVRGTPEVERISVEISLLCMADSELASRVVIQNYEPRNSPYHCCLHLSFSLVIEYPLHHDTIRFSLGHPRECQLLTLDETVLTMSHPSTV